MTLPSLKQSASLHSALDPVGNAPDTLPCTTPPDNMLIRRRIPCSDDARPDAQVASEYAVNQHIAASDHDASAKPPAIRPGEGTDDSAAADTCSLTVGHRRVRNSLCMHVRRCRIPT